MENRKTFALMQDASAIRPSTWIWLLPLLLRSPGASSSAAALCNTAECHGPSEPLPFLVLTISPPSQLFAALGCVNRDSSDGLM